MYQRRVKLQPEERTFYLITNRITGGSFILGDLEKEYFRKLLFEGQRRLGYIVWDYCILDNHYHALIEIPHSETMSRAELLRRWQQTQRFKDPGDPGDKILENYRKKIHDISLSVGNIQQRFTQWYNKRKNRWGKLFGGRFDSVIVDQNGAIAKMMAYIALNPVRAGIVADPAEYRWSGYGERMAKGNLQENELDLARFLLRELGLPDNTLKGNEKTVMKRIWNRFRECLLGHSTKCRDVNMQTIADILNKNNKPLELDWSQRLMLKVRFTTKGVAIGSKRFVEEVLKNYGEILGYRRQHEAQEARAWDQTYCLKKHRVWIG